MQRIKSNALNQAMLQSQDSKITERTSDSGRFGNIMSKAISGTLSTVATVAPIFPGGELVKMAAHGLQSLRSQSPGALVNGQGDSIEQMWAMQKENQVYNLQYLQLQNDMQADNRRFSTLSNLMKVRHDTAKSAIHNMQS